MAGGRVDLIEGLYRCVFVFREALSWYGQLWYIRRYREPAVVRFERGG